MLLHLHSVRMVCSRNFVKQMKGRGVRVIDGNDLVRRIADAPDHDRHFADEQAARRCRPEFSPS